jgi:hypothetical protein
MIRQFVRRHALGFGFVAVLLPLAVLLSLQYVWLVDLQKKSAIAEKAYLRNYLGQCQAGSSTSTGRRPNMR